MGMSATQARYTILTGRISDTEYEAQQVNQQRLNISNQMNAVYQSLCDMEVPTPPSKSDPEFSQTIYKGMGADKYITIRPKASGLYTATRVIPNGEIVVPTGTKEVSINVNPSKFLIDADLKASDGVAPNPGAYYEINNASDTSATKTPASSFVSGKMYALLSDSTGSNTVSGDELLNKCKNVKDMQTKTYVIDNGNGSYTKISGSNLNTISGNTKIYELPDSYIEAFDKAVVNTNIAASDEKSKGITVGGDPTMSMEAAVAKYGASGESNDAFLSSYRALQHSFPDTYNKEFTVIISTDDKGTETFSFCKTADMEADARGEGNGLTTVYEYTHGEYEEPIAELSNDDIHVDPSTGYLDTVTIDGDVIRLSSEKEFDEDHYNDAVSKYDNDKALYDQEQNRLNHMTEIYQRQDKMLELKLTRLDSERNALNTELEAVKKVIQDSIDRGFKTFSG